MADLGAEFQAIFVRAQDIPEFVKDGAADRSYGLHVAALAERLNDRTAVVWIANPNNPTGNLFDADEIHRLIQAAQIERDIGTEIEAGGLLTSIVHITSKSAGNGRYHDIIQCSTCCLPDSFHVGQ